MEERLVPLEQNGDLNLRSIARPEGLVGDCRVSWSSCHEFQSLTGTSAIQVIDPKNRAPLYEYRPGFVLAEDIPRLMQYTYLRLEFVAKKRNKNDVLRFYDSPEGCPNACPYKRSVDEDGWRVGNMDLIFYTIFLFYGHSVLFGFTSRYDEQGLLDY